MFRGLAAPVSVCKWRRLLPAAAEGPIKLHYGKPLGKRELRKPELSREEISLRVQYLEVAVEAAFVPQSGELHCLVQRTHQLFLLHALRLCPRIADKGIRHFSERRIN